MPITLAVRAQPSAVAQYPFVAQVSGYTGSITTLRLVAGINNSAVPATFGDLTTPATYGAWHEVTGFTWLRAPGANQGTAQDDGYPNGSVGDQLWWALVDSGGVPVGSDPLIAVSTVQLVGP